MTDDKSLETRNVSLQVWVGLGGTFLLSVLLRLCLGALPQDPSYHHFADTRRFLGAIPRAGDVLTNLAILAAATFWMVIRRRMVLSMTERAAAKLLIWGTALMAIGSTYYHWNLSMANY